MMSGVMTAESRFPGRLAQAAALGLCAGLLLLPGEADCRPMHPAPPTWRIQPAPPRTPIRHTPKKRKKDAVRSGWAAITEPVNTASIAAEVVPLPDRKPQDAAVPLAADRDVEVRHAAAEPDAGEAEKGAPPPKLDDDVTVTGVTGEDERPRAATPAEGTPAELYCRNIGDAAAEARYARQKQELQKTEKEVAKRVEELNAKIAEYRSWMARRDAFSRKADAAVVSIYSKMKPDAAAQQLAILDEELAAALLLKLNPRVASAVMDEMDSRHAARLAAIIAMSTRGPGRKPPAAPEKRTP